MPATVVALQLDDDNPWPGLAQYTEASQDYFHGRDRDVAELLQLLRLSPFVMLYGKSGLGKSSMLQAGAFPRLRDALCLPVYLRLNYSERAEPPLQQALARLMQEIATAGRDAPTPEPNESLWAYLQRRERPIWTADNFPLTPVLVFDQFEEVFSHGGSPEHVKWVLDSIADLVGNRLPRALADDPSAAERLNLQTQQYLVVLSFRSDFLDKVTSWERQASLPKHEALDLSGMTREIAIAAVEKAGAAVLEPGVAKEIVNFVVGRDDAGTGGADMVEPVLLSLCCFQLNNRRERPGKIDAGLLKRAGEDILLDFYAGALAGTEPRVAVFIEDNLIQGGRYRNSFPRDEAIASGALTADDLELLQRRRLLRVDSQGGVPRIELIHDRLVGIVRDAREARRKIEQAEAERKAAARQAEEAQRANALAQAQRESQRIRRWRNGLASVLLLLVFALGWLWHFANQSNDYAKQAREYAEQASVRKELAEANAARAEEFAASASAAAAYAETERTHAVRAADEMGEQKSAAEAAKVRAEQAEVRARASSLRAEGLRLAVDSQAMLAGTKAGSEERAFQQLLAARLLWPDPRIDAPTFSALVSRQHVERFEPVVVKTESNPTALTFSSDGQLLAVGHQDGSVSLRLATNPAEPIAAALGHSETVQGIAITHDGGQVVTASNDGTLRRWRVQPLRPEGEPMRGHDGAVFGVAISPDGRRIASAGRDGTVRLWDFVSGAELARASPMPPGSLFGVAFNPRGGATLAVVTAASDTTNTSSLVVLDAETLVIKGTPLYAHSHDAFALAYSPSGRYLVTGGEDAIVRVRDLRGDGVATVRMMGRGDGDLLTVAFSPNERWVAAGSVQGTVRLWTAATGEPLGLPLTGHKNSVSSLVFSPRGDWLASGADDGTMRLWRLDLSWTARGGAAPEGAVSVAIGRDGTRALFGLSSGALLLRDEGTAPRTFSLPASGPSAGAALAGCKPAPATEPRQQSSRGQNAPPQTDRGASSAQAARVVVLVGDGRIALSGHQDGTLRRWNLDTGALVGAPLRPSECALMALAASSDGKRIAAANREGTVLLLDAAGKLLQTHSLSAQVTALALAGDGLQLAVGSSEPPSLKVYAAGQTKPESLAGVLEVPTSLAFGPGDAVIVSGSAEGNVRLWDVPRRLPMTAPEQASRGPVQALTFGSDGKRFYSAGSDGGARPWPAPASWSDLMCKKISANPSRRSWREWISDELPYRCSCPGKPIEPDDPVNPPSKPDICPGVAG